MGLFLPSPGSHTGGLQCEDGLLDGYVFTIINDCLVAYLMTITNGVSTIIGSVVLDSDLTVTVSLDGHRVSPSHYDDIFKGRMDSLSQLMNLMARLKSWVTEPSQMPLAVCTDVAVNMLKRCRENLDDDSDDRRKLSFVREQLQLLSTSKFSRTYCGKGKNDARNRKKRIVISSCDKFIQDNGGQRPASVAQWAEAQCAPAGTVCRRGGFNPRVGRQISCSDFRGTCFEINFSGRQRGFDGVLYNL